MASFSRVRAFDWDDNLVFMPTRLIMYKNEEEFVVQSDIFNIIRDPESRRIHSLENYELKMPESFKYFSDAKEGNASRYFVEDLEEILQTEGWKGPRFKEFQDATESEESANMTFVITSRKQSPQTIHVGLVFLANKGLIKHVPPVENLWPVGWPGFASIFDSKDYKAVPLSKALAIKMIIEQHSCSDVVLEYCDDDEGIIKRISDFFGDTIINDKSVNMLLEFVGSRHTSEPPASYRLEVGRNDCQVTLQPERIHIKPAKAFINWYPSEIKLNTSHPRKLAEFKQYLSQGIETDTKDLQEPDSDPITIIRYKASQFDGHVMVDDTSLVIEGENIGANVKWYLNNLSSYIGKKAWFICMLGIKIDGHIHIFRGEVVGRVVERKGESFGFLPHFQPASAEKTLAEELPDKFNARFYALQNFKMKDPYVIAPTLETWSGPWQNE